MLTLCQGLIVRRLLPVFGEKRLALGGAVLLMAGFGLVGWSAAPASGASAESRVISPHDETSAAEKVLAPGMSEGTPVVEATGGTHGPLVQLFLVLPVAIAGFSAVNPSLQSLLSLNADSAEQGEMLGLAQSMSALARILGPVLGIVLFSTRGVQSPYWCAALMMAVAAFGISMLKAEAAPGDVSEMVEALSERFE
jgi:MFS family permease